MKLDKIIKHLLLGILFASVIQTATFAADSPDPYANETAAQRDARMQWWREARFGMFIHYGPVTLTGQEISWSRANSNPKCPNQGKTPVEIYDHLYQT